MITAGLNGLKQGSFMILYAEMTGNDDVYTAGRGGRFECSFDGWRMTLASRDRANQQRNPSSRLGGNTIQYIPYAGIHLPT